MQHLDLNPTAALDIDFEIFAFPKLAVTTRPSGNDVLVTVWSEGRGFLLFDRDLDPDSELIDEIRAEVDAFNADRFSGWRELLVAAYAGEKEKLDREQAEVDARRSKLRQAEIDAGFAIMMARWG